MKSFIENAFSGSWKNLQKEIKVGDIYFGAPGDKTKTVDRALKALSRLIQDSHCSIKTYENIIRRGDLESPCIIVPKVPKSLSKGHFFDWNEQKLYPHYVACRLFRFPDMNDYHQLIPSYRRCKAPFNRKSNHVCINPFHYNSLRRPKLPPVRIPNKIASQDYQQQQYKSNDRINIDTSVQTLVDAMETDAYTHHDMIPNTTVYCDMTLDDRIRQLVDSYNYAGSDTTTETGSISGSYQNDYTSNPGSQGYLSDDMDSEINSPSSETIKSFDDDHINVPYTEPDAWCSIYYYERTLRVGSHFQGKSPSIVIDTMYLTKTESHMALGAFSNEMRSSEVKETRESIGRGIRLYYIADDIYVENLSNHSVFIQSPNCNMRNDWHPATVVKVPPGCHCNMFSYSRLASLLNEAAKVGYEAVYSLTRTCTVRLSFGKGWGNEYKRPTVSSTPCWLEIHLHGALRWVDNVLSHMNSPEMRVSSFT
uniref:Mothers against decapentaplegic homolog n=1 Tax=Strongyloides stercoralis TaxID=6248 RepID=A0A0K0DVW1_STRER|nr:SMAD-8A [Strongyloides stercoralis]